MTFTAKELAANGVDPRAIKWRQWRRAHRLTLNDCTEITGVSADTIIRYETGRSWPRPVHVAALEALMTDWREDMRPAPRPDGRRRKVKP